MYYGYYMTESNPEFLKKYHWADYKDRLCDTYKIIDGKEVVIPKDPNLNLKYHSRTLDDDVIFFKSVEDMIAFDTRDTNYDHVNRRGEYLRNVVGVK